MTPNSSALDVCDLEADDIVDCLEMQPSPEHGISKTPVRGASTIGLNSGLEDSHLLGGGGCEQFSPSMYLLKECR